jgi:hypothetical protein
MSEFAPPKPQSYTKSKTVPNRSAPLRDDVNHTCLGYVAATNLPCTNRAKPDYDNLYCGQHKTIYAEQDKLATEQGVSLRDYLKSLPEDRELIDAGPTHVTELVVPNLIDEHDPVVEQDHVQDLPSLNKDLVRKQGLVRKKDLVHQEQQDRVREQERQDLVHQQDLFHQERQDLVRQQDLFHQERQDLVRQQDLFYQERQDLVRQQDLFHQERQDLVRQQDLFHQERQDLVRQQDLFYQERQELVRQQDLFHQERQERQQDLFQERQDLVRQQDLFHQERQDLVRQQEDLVRQQDLFHQERQDLVRQQEDLVGDQGPSLVGGHSIAIAIIFLLMWPMLDATQIITYYGVMMSTIAYNGYAIVKPAWEFLLIIKEYICVMYNESDWKTPVRQFLLDLITWILAD